MKAVFRKMHICMLLVVCLIVMLPSAVMAASGRYVPVEGTITYADGQKGTVRYSYKKDGRIKSYTEIWPNGTHTQTYRWKKGLVKSVNIVSADGSSETSIFSYKNGYLLKWENRASDDRDVTAVFSWKGRKATYVQTSSDGYEITGTAKVNKKKQEILATYDISGDSSDVVAGTSKRVFAYYKDGKFKSEKQSGNLSWRGSVESDVKYNKAGYVVSGNYRFQDGTTITVTYRYTNDRKKKCPKKIVVTETYGGETTVVTYEFTKFKKVSRVRNCDDFGHLVPLGAN